MTVKELIKATGYSVINAANNVNRAVESVFCCDLLSIAMSKAPAGCAWVTVMGNMNTLAVASLADAAVIIMAEGISLDENAVKKAKEQNITVLKCDEPIFAAALKIHTLLHG